METTKQQAYSEVYAIINLMSWTLVNKIPNKILKNIEDKRDKNYFVEIDDIDEYKPSEQANRILAVLYKNYFASEQEKKVIQAKEKRLYEQAQKELNKKFNQESLFNNKKKSINVEHRYSNEIMMKCKESIFTKLINKINSIFKLR